MNITHFVIVCFELIMKENHIIGQQQISHWWDGLGLDGKEFPLGNINVHQIPHRGETYATLRNVWHSSRLLGREASIWRDFAHEFISAFLS